MDYFETLEDPRIERCKRHQLLDIIAIATPSSAAPIPGMNCSARASWNGSTFLELPHGIPSHDTFGDVFSRLDPEQFASWPGPRQCPT